MVILPWPNTGPHQKGEDSSPQSVALNLHKCVSLTAYIIELATGYLCVSLVPPHQLELVTRGASREWKGR